MAETNADQIIRLGQLVRRLEARLDELAVLPNVVEHLAMRVKQLETQEGARLLLAIPVPRAD